MKRRYIITVAVLVWLLLHGFSFEKGRPVDLQGLPVWVVDHGYHTGLLISRQTLESEAGHVGREMLREFPSATWFEFGWGDKGFYEEVPTIADATVPIVTKALFWPTDTVMHVATGYGTPEYVVTGASSVKITLSRKAMSKMIGYIEEGFQGTTATAPGLYAISKFFPGSGKYHLFRTCNNWVSQALRESGIGSSPLFATFSGSLVWELRVRYGV